MKYYVCAPVDIAVDRNRLKWPICRPWKCVFVGTLRECVEYAEGTSGMVCFLPEGYSSIALSEPGEAQ